MTDWNKLKVTELKDELKSRGISLTGLKLKADFVAKLQELETITVDKIDKLEAENAHDEVVQPENAIEDDRAQPAETDTSAPEESLPSAQVNKQAQDHSNDQAVNATLPEDVDMYSASQLKPTPSQPLTEILAAKEDAIDEAKLETRIEGTPPPAPTLIASDVSTPVPVKEIVDDSRKRKRRSATPPPSTMDIALKKAKGGDGTPTITKHESSLEQMQAATDAAEAIQAPDGLGDYTPIVEDAPGSRGAAERKPSQSTDIATGNAQPALRDSPPKDSSGSIWNQSDHHVAPAIHQATRSLYLRDFKRPLQGPVLRNHLVKLARSSSDTTDPITVFYLDNIRTHALVSFQSTTTAARVRSAMHQSIFPDEASRMPIWVDFIPDDAIEAWIAEETAGSDRNRKWEIVYNDGLAGATAVHQIVDVNRPPQKPSAPQPRTIPVNDPAARSTTTTVPGVHPDRASLVPVDRDQHNRGLISRSDTKTVGIPANDTGVGFKALDELFSSTTAKPKLYYKPVPAVIAEGRMELIKDLRVTHNEMGRSGDEGMKRYSFEPYKGREEWVDKGPEFGYGRRGVEALAGRRGRGGGFRGSRGEYRGRGGDSWRGRY